MNPLAQYLKTLVRFRTLSLDNETNLEALKWIKDQVEDLPLYLNAVTINRFPSLIITTQKTIHPKLWLSAHIDVVPAPDHAFQPKISANKLYGRGALDMKSSIACYLRLLVELGATLGDYEFGIMLTSDEERGGVNGAGSLLKDAYGGEACLLPDGHAAWRLDIAAKGAAHFRFEAASLPGHAATPWTQRGANEKILQTLEALQSHFVDEPCGDDAHDHSTVTVGQIAGGDQTNSTAATAWAEVDIRLASDMSYQRVSQLVADIVAKIDGVSVTELVHAEGFAQNEDDRYFADFRTIAKEVAGVDMTSGRAHGTSDARFFVGAGMPTIITRPEGGGSHEDEEWVDLADLERFYVVMKTFVTRVAKRS